MKLSFPLSIIFLFYINFHQIPQSVIGIIFEKYNCHCDYYLPTYLLSETHCGQFAVCSWDMDYYTKNVPGSPPPPPEFQFSAMKSFLATEFESKVIIKIKTLSKYFLIITNLLLSIPI
jgi:hypothetical protein